MATQPNSNFWKDRYQSSWAFSNKREKFIADKIESETGLKVQMSGFGAGTTEYLPGNAKDYGKHSGDADLQVVGTNVFVEVTGPQNNVPAYKPLWIRPDKIISARNEYPKSDIWLAHIIGDNNGLLRVIHFDEQFFDSFDRNQFRYVEPRIRGTVERYFEISSKHKCVQNWNALINFLKG